MHFFFIIAGLVLLLAFWRVFAGLAIVVAVIGGIALVIALIANQPAFDTPPAAQLAAIGLAPWGNDTAPAICQPAHDYALRSYDTAVVRWAERHPCSATGDPNSASSRAVAAAWSAILARELATKQQAEAQAAAQQAQRVAQQAAHEAARPKECRNWKQPEAYVNEDGVTWLASDKLEHARRCADWEANAAAVLAGTHECHRLPSSWNYTVQMFQDEANARSAGSWCMRPANPWPAERDAFTTDAERAAAAAAEQARLARDFRWSESRHAWVEPCEQGRVHLMLGSPDTLTGRDKTDLLACTTPAQVEEARAEHACIAAQTELLRSFTGRPWELQKHEHYAECMAAARAKNPRGVDSAG